MIHTWIVMAYGENSSNDFKFVGMFESLEDATAAAMKDKDSDYRYTIIRGHWATK